MVELGRAEPFQFKMIILSGSYFLDASTSKLWLYSLNIAVLLSRRSHLANRAEVGEVFLILF
jgi:hypothetical protein